MAKCFSKKYENRDELSATLYLQSEINLFCQDACQCLMYIPTSLPQEQAAKTKILNGKDPAKRVFSIMHS